MGDLFAPSELICLKAVRTLDTPRWTQITAVFLCVASTKGQVHSFLGTLH